MTRRQTRLFAIAATATAVVVFLGLTLDTHRQFPALTNEAGLTPQVIAGKNVWHRYNCTNCHTLFGEGAYYAPDLTKIANQRSADYLRAFLKDPGAFYDEQKYRRVMPPQNLSEQEIADVIAFLGWVATVDTQGWPPRPILVSGGAIPGTQLVAVEPLPAGPARPGTVLGAAAPIASAPSAEPVAKGQALFNGPTATCFACHSTAPGVNLAGPSLAGIGARAATTVAQAQYTGQAKDGAGYIRESILNPHAYLVAGPTYSAAGRSFMPDHFGKVLTPEQVDEIVAYLTTLQ
jgi:nitric oxide reductase subunit C